MTPFCRKISLIAAIISITLQLHISFAANSTDDEKEETSVDTDLDTSPSLHTISEKAPEFISHAATMIIMEPGKTTESATAAVLETTESDDEGVKKLSTSGITSTMSTKAEPSKEEAPEQTFAVWDSNGKICLLAKFQAEFKISFPSKGGDEGVSSAWLPENIKSRGKCGDENKAPALLLSWEEYALHIWFSKLSHDDNNTKDEWALTSMELRYDMSSTLFDGATNTGKKTARSKSDLQAFKTDFGRSYYCPTGKVNLFISNKKVVTVDMKNIQLQPFSIEDGKFSKAQRCDEVVIGGPEEPPIQDETVPLAVGLTLTILTLIVVLGFSVHRAYTMRKVDYNSME